MSVGKYDLVAQLLAAKEASGKTFTQISQEIGLTNAFTAQLFYNQVSTSSLHQLCLYIVHQSPVGLDTTCYALHASRHAHCQVQHSNLHCLLDAQTQAELSTIQLHFQLALYTLTGE